MSEGNSGSPPQTTIGSSVQEQRMTGNNEGATTRGSKSGAQRESQDRRTRHAWKPANYGGENEDIDVILALRDEFFEKRVQYTIFIDKVKNYVLQNFSYAKDVVPILEKLEDTEADVLAQGPSDLSQEDEKNFVKKWRKQEEIKEHALRLRTLAENKTTLYGVVWGQCSTALQEVIKTDSDFVAKDASFDCIWLLKKCKLVSSGVDDKGNKHNTLVKALLQFCNIKQQEFESNDAYRTRLDSTVLTLELAGGKHVLCSNELIVAAKKEKPTEAEIRVEEEKLKAMLMIVRADPIRYSLLQHNLEEGVYLGRDEYPETVTQAYDLLQKTCPEVPSRRSSRNWRFRRNKNRNQRSRLSFAQVGNGESPTPGTDGRVFAHINCHSCGKYGHFANKCPGGSKQVTALQVMLHQQGVSFSQKSQDVINPNWLLLDTCSTVSVCCNKDMVTGIKPCGDDGPLRITTNGGAQAFYNTATLKMLPMTVHFNAKSLANILSLSDVANLPGARLTMDTDIERAIVLHYNNKQIRFRECYDGLYYLDVRHIKDITEPTHSDHNDSNACVIPYSNSSSKQFLQTVHNNSQLYTKKEIKGARNARTLQAQIGWPSTTQFLSILASNSIRNCSVTIDDVNRALHIFGPPVPLLQGKMTRGHPQKAQPTEGRPSPENQGAPPGPRFVC